MKNLIEKYESLGYVLTVKEELNIALCMKAKSKARFPKALFNYRFKSPERMAEYCSEWIERIERRIHEAIVLLAIKKEAQKNMNHNFVEGSIIYNSWGYDQTNIDFYQIVEVKTKSVIIRRIESCYVSGTEGFMCANVKPIKDCFLGEPILKKIVTSVNYSGNISYHIKAKYGCFCNFIESKEEKGVYSSWYA
jgi:hypothetical protein